MKIPLLMSVIVMLVVVILVVLLILHLMKCKYDSEFRADMKNHVNNLDSDDINYILNANKKEVEKVYCNSVSKSAFQHMLQEGDKKEGGLGECMQEVLLYDLINKVSSMIDKDINNPQDMKAMKAAIIAVIVGIVTLHINTLTPAKRNKA